MLLVCAIVCAVLVASAWMVVAASARVILGISTARPSSALTWRYIRAAGVRPGIEMWFSDFDAPLVYPSDLVNVASVGAEPMVTWDPVKDGVAIPYKDIVRGRYDRYIRAQARRADSLHTPIYIRFAHEMNIESKASPWGGGRGNTAAKFVEAWRHIVRIFRRRGATNVRWVWAPNTDCAGACPFAAYYPGDAWVSDVGLDGYNYSRIHHVPWMSLAHIFGQSYRRLTAMTRKPVMFTETASTEAGGNKAKWITRGFLHAIPKLFPRVTAVIWWQRVDQTDWRVNSSACAEAAWRRVAASPIYGGSGKYVAPRWVCRAHRRGRSSGRGSPTRARAGI